MTLAPQDEIALRALVEQLEQAWNRNDAEAFAAPFAEDAEFIHILGGGGTGKAAIRAGHEALFRTIYARSEVAYEVARILALGDSAAAVLIRQRLRFEADGGTQEMHCRPTLVAERCGGTWTIRLFQNTQVAGAGSAGATTAVAAHHPHRA